MGTRTFRQVDWRLDETGPKAYERYLVPAFGAPCADQLLDAVELTAGERILEVACKLGIVARRAAARVGDAGHVAGADPSDEILEVARAAAAGAGQTIEWHRADATALPFREGSFDVVCCQQALQFLPDRDKTLVLREMRSLLLPDGRLAIAVWRPIDVNPGFLSLSDTLQRHVSADAAAMMRRPFTAPARAQWCTLLASAGFGEPRIRTGIFATRFPSAEEFLRRMAAATPLAGPLAALDAEARQVLVDDLAKSLQPYADDDGVTFPMQTWLITARA